LNNRVGAMDPPEAGPPQYFQEVSGRAGPCSVRNNTG